MVRTLHTRYAVLYIGENENKQRLTKEIVSVSFAKHDLSKHNVKITADQIVLFHPEN